jgi:hypothetical protein
MMNEAVPGSWNPKTLLDVINGKGIYLKPVNEMFSNEGLSETQYIEMYENYKKAFNVINTFYPPIEIPVNTLIFHSNQFFANDINEYEPLGTQMKMQDIRRYANKGERRNDLNFPMSERASRLYCNFTPAGNQFVAGNLNVSESIYKSTEPLTFFQLPAILDSEGNVHHIKDILALTSTVLFREYIKYKNNNPEKKKYCGFILSTTVDSALVIDRNTLYFEQTSGYVYPEILLMDGFSKFIKVGQYDLYKDESLKEFGENEYLALSAVTRDFGVPRIPIFEQIKKIIDTYEVKFVNVNNYGPFSLPVYIATKHDAYYTNSYMHDDDL